MIRFLLSSWLLILPTAAESAAPARLHLETNPDPSGIHPREDTLSFRIRIQHPDGRPVSGARLKIQLKAPDTPWLGSTDFPVVEGTLLLNQDFPIMGSTHSFQFVPPIRGRYTLSAQVEPLPGDSSFAPMQSSWETTIEESLARKKNLGMLLALLICVGGISGFVIGRSPRSAAVIVLLLLLWPHAPLKAHGSHQHKSAGVPPAETTASPIGNHVELNIVTPEPRVGELTEIAARYQNAQGETQPARFQLEIMQLEHAHTVFATELIAPDGILRWKGQFFDGSPHRVSVTARPLHAQGERVKAERDVEVTGVEPPLRSVIKSFGLLMTVTALALLLGILLGRNFPERRRGLTWEKTSS